MTYYFLFSPSTKKYVKVGSNGMGGIQSYPGEEKVVEFIRWVIAEGITDVVIKDEDEITSMAGWPSITEDVKEK